MNEAVYKVHLPRPFSDYNHVELTSERSADASYCVRWLNIEKVILATTKYDNQKWIPLNDASDEWHTSNFSQSKFQYFVWAWNPEPAKTKLGEVGRLAHMPRISGGMRGIRINYTRWQKIKIKLGLMSQEPDASEFFVTFGNGRHRTEFFRGQGVEIIPFEVPCSCADLVASYCS